MPTFSDGITPKSNYLYLLFALVILLETLLFFYSPAMFLSYSIPIICLFLLVINLKHYRIFIRDWLIFLCLINAFNIFRGLAYVLIQKYNIPIHSQYVINFEHLLVPETTLSHILQNYHLLSGLWLKLTLTVIYASHFIYFFIVAFVIWHYFAKDFARFKYAFIFCIYSGLCIYLFMPTMPPWLASAHQLIQPVQNLFTSLLKHQFSPLLNFFDTNPVAAMPSLHVAFPFLCFLSLRYHYGRRAWPALIYALSMIFATLYLGAHFIADILAGILLASLAYTIFYRLWQPPPYHYSASNAELGTSLAYAIIILIIPVIISNLTGIS